MHHPGRIYPPLDAEVEQVLVQLVEQARKVERAKREFLAIGVDQLPGMLIRGAGIDGQFEVAPQDLQELADRDLIRVMSRSRGTFQFYVTSSGETYYRELKQRGDPVEQVQDEVVRLIESADFAATHPGASAKWRAAYRLYSENPVGNASRIGHDCREAMMAFANSLAETRGVEVGARPEQTVSRVRAVIQARGEALGGRTTAFFDALLACWGTVSDLVQRQEHAGSKEGESLTAEDARRVVWYTALVMQELHRVL